MKATTKKKSGGKQRGPSDRVSLYEKTGFHLILLVILTCIVYSGTLLLGYTRLDDSIFIVENAAFNENFGNIVTAFQRGLFHPTNDAYYRPLFLVDFIIESRLFGTNPAGYHFTNLLLHLGSVVLLYFFLKKINIPAYDALLLSLLFSVHPVLTQAVAWIPGRNDMLLMILFLSTFIVTLNYGHHPSAGRLISASLLYLMAMFTKETAIIIPVIIAGFMLLHMKYSWKKTLPPFGAFMVMTGIWYLVRSKATLSPGQVTLEGMISAGISRLEVIVQYIGKIFLPVNLAVFPEAKDISLVWGFLSLILLTVLIILSKSYIRLIIYLGIVWFLAFLLPVLIVPKSLNDQVFEHRLYLPIVGILLVISQVIPFAGKSDNRLKTIIAGVIVVIFSIQSMVRTAYFRDPLTFWTHAVAGSPNSAYAHMLLGTKVENEEERLRLFRKAYAIDPDQKNLKYYLGKVLMDKEVTDSAIYFIRLEVATNPQPDSYFTLAQLWFKKNQLDSAGIYLQKVIGLAPLHPEANHNLAVLYYQTGRLEKAREVIVAMQEKGMAVNQDLMPILKSGQ